MFALLLAVRRQWHQELASRATEEDAAERRVTELYTKAVEQLGSSEAHVRLGGLYALDRLAQSTSKQRQTIVDVMCAYLRMPYQLPIETFKEGPKSEAYRSAVQEREVRIAAERILTSHLRRGHDHEPAETFWEDIDLDLRQARLLEFDLSSCILRRATFENAMFAGFVSFERVRFTGPVKFNMAEVHGLASFRSAVFEDRVSFAESEFIEPVDFWDVEFSADVTFKSATFRDRLTLSAASITGSADFGAVSFERYANFANVSFGEEANFSLAQFGSNGNFFKAKFRKVALFTAVFVTGKLGFAGAEFAMSYSEEIQEYIESDYDDDEPIPYELV